jgi:tol-pal system protein YbgF
MSLATCALVGCAGASQARPETATAADAAQQPGVLGALQRQSAAQEQRIAELEARLGLLEQEAREWRAAVPVKPSQTVRIGAPSRVEAETGADEQPERGARQRVPVVRLHQRDLEPVDEPLVLPEPPSGVASKLPVVPLPAARAGKAIGGSPATSREADTREQYRAALRALRDQRWDEALQILSAFLSEHPGSALAEDATYWRGEVHYAQRRYREALTDFEAVALRPSGSKVAQALLKLGLCHQRLGDTLSAERYFRQLREQYPSSDAARIASRENPS